MITEAELIPGLVMHLDPDTLLAQGGTYSCSDDQRVRGGHFFLCLSVQGSLGCWLPLYSNPGVGRTQLTADGRSGHPKWTSGTFYWHQDQVWTAMYSAVVAAAAAGRDMSRAGSRNELDKLHLPPLAGGGG